MLALEQLQISKVRKPVKMFITKAKSQQQVQEQTTTKEFEFSEQVKHGHLISPTQFNMVK